MGIKENIKKSFATEKEIVIERYTGAKFIFVIVGFLFFLNFFFVGAGFYNTLFLKTLTFSYILFVLSLLNYLYFYIYKSFLGQIGLGFKIFLIIIFILFFILFSFPFIIDGGILPFIQKYIWPYLSNLK